MEERTRQSLPQTGAHIYWQLFATFFKIGGFTFGGGWAMISIIQREICEKHKWIPEDEFLDLLAVAQSLPGILAVNIATAVGDRIKGGKGSAVASLGTILPSFLIILAIAIFLTPETIKNNRVISSIFMGIRPCVVALIVAPVISSAKAAHIRLSTLWIPAIVALMISLDLGFISNPILYILLGAAGGYLCFHHNTARLKKGK